MQIYSSPRLVMQDDCWGLVASVRPENVLQQLLEVTQLQGSSFLTPTEGIIASLLGWFANSS